MLEARRAALSRSRFSATTISPTALRLPWRRRRFGFGGGLQAGEFWPEVRPHRLTEQPAAGGAPAWAWGLAQGWRGCGASGASSEPAAPCGEAQARAGEAAESGSIRNRAV